MRRQRGSLIVYGILALVVLVTLAGIGRSIYNAGGDSVRVEWEEANRLQREAEAKQAEQASTKLEASREKAKVVYRTITKEVDKVVTRDVYRNVCLDADGLRIAAAAIRGEIAAPKQPDKPVPKPAGTDGGGWRVSFKMDSVGLGNIP